MGVLWSSVRKSQRHTGTSTSRNTNTNTEMAVNQVMTVLSCNCCGQQVDGGFELEEVKIVVVLDADHRRPRLEKKGEGGASVAGPGREHNSVVPRRNS